MIPLVEAVGLSTVLVPTQIKLAFSFEALSGESLTIVTGFQCFCI